MKLFVLVRQAVFLSKPYVAHSSLTLMQPKMTENNQISISTTSYLLPIPVTFYSTKHSLKWDQHFIIHLLLIIDQSNMLRSPY